MVDFAAKLRENARRIEVDGTPSQVGMSPEELREVATEIEVMRASFSAATLGMDHKEVFNLITDARAYVQEMQTKR